MTTEQTTHTTLYRKLAAIAGELATVEKDGRNKDQGYTYPTPASVFRAIKPLLAKYHVAIVPMQAARQEVDTGRQSRSGTPYILTSVDMSYLILDGESGESITAPWIGVAGAYGDDKGNAKAQTIALRTFLIQLFQIPAEDMETDPDAGGPPPVARREQRPARTEYVPADDDRPPADGIQDKRKYFAELRSKAVRARITYKPPKSPGDMSALELDAAINAVEMLLNAPPARGYTAPIEEVST